MSLKDMFVNLFGKSPKKEDEGVKVVFEPKAEGDPTELKGFKLADCTCLGSDGGCSILA